MKKKNKANILSESYFFLFFFFFFIIFFVLSKIFLLIVQDMIHVVARGMIVCITVKLIYHYI